MTGKHTQTWPETSGGQFDDIYDAVRFTDYDFVLDKSQEMGKREMKRVKKINREDQKQDIGNCQGTAIE